jgi:acyl carrier protein
MPAEDTKVAGGKSADEIQARLVAELADRLRIEADRIDVNAPLTRYGLDSAEAASLAYELEVWLGRVIQPGMLFDAESIADFARMLAEPPRVQGG